MQSVCLSVFKCVFRQKRVFSREKEFFLIQISINHDTPITSAVLTVKNHSQAEERANGGVKDRAIEAALSLVNLINLKKEF